MPTPREVQQPLSAIGTSLFAILGILRSEALVTRPTLESMTGLGRKMVTQRVDELFGAGLLADGPVLITPRKGRPPTPVTFRADAGHVLVGELSPATFVAGICDLSGNLLDWREEEVEFDLGPEVVLGRLDKVWRELLEDAPRSGYRVRAIGVGVLGPVDQISGLTMDVGQIRAGWGGFPMRSRLSELYGVPAWIDNDANMTAIGEYERRHVDSRRNAADDFVFVKIDDGIGGGLISGGQVHRGTAGVAGEIGHIKVTDDPTRTCWCGGIGCLVTVAGSEAIEQEVNSRPQKDLGPVLAATWPHATFSDVVTGASTGDPVAITTLREAGRATGRALASVANVFNPSDVVIGGIIALAGDIFLTATRESLDRAAFPAAGSSVRLSLSPLSDRRGLIGAAITAIDGLLSPDFAQWWLPPEMAEAIFARPSNSDVAKA